MDTDKAKSNAETRSSAKQSDRPKRGSPTALRGSDKARERKATRKSASRSASTSRNSSDAKNKAAFVRAQPLAKPAGEVVRAAAALGMTMTANYVHKVRSANKAKRAPGKASVARPRKRQDAVVGKATVSRPHRSPASSLRGAGPESAFRSLVLELGLQRANALVAEVERKLEALIAGR